MRYEVRARVLVVDHYEPVPFIFLPFRTKMFAKRCASMYNGLKQTVVCEYYVYDRKEEKELY